MSEQPAGSHQNVASPQQLDNRFAGLGAAVGSQLKDAESPLDFVKANLIQPETAAEPKVETVDTPEAAAERIVNNDPEADILNVSFKDREPAREVEDSEVDEVEEVQEPEKKERNILKEILGVEDEPDDSTGEESGEDEQESGDDSVEAKKSKGPRESIKDLRKKTQELSKALEDERSTREQLQSQYAKFETGEDIPVEVKEKYETRIKELEPYEKLHALKLSKEYKENYVEPFNALKEEAAQLAEDYKVDIQVFEQATKIENKRDLHSYLRKHFDDVGTLEARDLVLKARNLRQAAREAEMSPAQTLQALQQERTERETKEAEMRLSRINTVSKDSWKTAMHDLASDGRSPELTLQPNNPEHNKFVQPIIEKASTEYDAFVGWMAKNGVSDLPPAIAKNLAVIFAKAYSSEVAKQSREHHYNRAEAVLQESQKRSQMTRPPIGAANRGGTTIGDRNAERPSSPMDAADALIRQVRGA